jgi:uncharacterized damage-inducible protein DinB
MKKLLLFAVAAVMISFSAPENTITKKEKKFAAKFLKETRAGVFESVKDLSEAQLKFKPSDGGWSVEECLKHIAITEQMLWSMLDGNLKQPPTPDKRGEVKITDEDIVKKVEDRSTKVKTMDPAKPENTPYASAAVALAAFKDSREKLIDYTKSTDADLRNHIVTGLPFGAIDGYQFILFISAHSNRHMQQIIEVKANPDFPKS